MHDKLVWCVASDVTVRGGSIVIIGEKKRIINDIFLSLFSLFLKKTFLSCEGMASGTKQLLLSFNWIFTHGLPIFNLCYLKSHFRFMLLDSVGPAVR